MADEAGELARAEAAVGLAREPAALFDRRVGVFSELRLLLVGCCAAGAVSGRINRGLARAELRGCRRVWARHLVVFAYGELARLIHHWEHRPGKIF